jgi:hypothetical protein
MSLASFVSSRWFRIPLAGFAVVATVATSQPPPETIPGDPSSATPTAERLTLQSGESRTFKLRFSSTSGAVVSSRLGAFDPQVDASIRVDHVDSRPGCSTSEVFRSVDGKWVTGALEEREPVLRSACLDASPSGTVTVTLTNVDQANARFTWSPVGEPLGGDRDRQGRTQTVSLQRMP